jgi:hypothetical protein
MSSRSARRRGDAGVARWEPAAKCWCGFRAQTLARVGALTAPVCWAHVDPDTWPHGLLVELVGQLSLGGRSPVGSARAN